MIRSVAAVLATVAALAGAAAADDAGGVEAPRTAFLELRVNEVASDTVLAILDGGDAWVSPAALTRAGLSRFGGTRRDLDGRTLVSLRSLAPDLSFEVDEHGLALRIAAGPALLGRGQVDLRASARPAGLETGTVRSAFLNYAVRGDTTRDRSAFAEAGVSLGPALLNGAVSMNRDGEAVRGLTALTIDDVPRLVRFTAGDVLTAPDALGGAPTIGGLTLARELSLDPYLVRAPLPRATAFAQTPSTVEVWVNGALARTETVSPGTYDLSQLPVTSGANDVRIVVRDAFGRTHETLASHYQAAGLLARGLQQWAWHAGVVREGFGSSSFEYGDPVVVGWHRAGLTERLTAGARVEATAHVRQGGASFAAALPVGELEAAGAASEDGGVTGAAGLLAWRYGSRRLSGGVDAAVRSRRYANASLRAIDERALLRAGAFLALPLAAGTSLHLQYSAGVYRDGAERHRLDARTSIPLGRRATVLLGAGLSRTGSARPEATGLVQLVVATHDGSAVDAGVRAERAGTAAGLGAQRGLPPGAGYGYRVRADTGGEGGLSALVQGQVTFGRVEAGYDRFAGVDRGTASASGALVLVGDRLFATRPVEASFALVRVPGVKDVHVLLENNVVGRTNARGDLLVPGLLPYYGNKLSISDADVPASYRIGATRRVVAAPPRGGALVQFDVAPLTAVEGWLSVGSALHVPAYGTLEVDVPGGTRSSPIGADGAFWLEDVPAGTHPARVYFDGDVCELGLSIPESSAGVVQLGQLGCTPRPGSPSPDTRL